MVSTNCPMVSTNCPMVSTNCPMVSTNCPLALPQNGCRQSIVLYLRRWKAAYLPLSSYIFLTCETCNPLYIGISENRREVYQHFVFSRSSSPTPGQNPPISESK